MPLKTYLDFAENDYRYFVSSCERGDVANVMGAIAQNICEKYMKHLIDEYDKPVTTDEEEDKTRILKSHNLQHLVSYIRENLAVNFSYNTTQKMRDINGYYISARYPSDMVINELSKNAIDKCLVAVQGCRQETLELMKQLDRNATMLEDRIGAANKLRAKQPNDHSAPKDRDER